MSKTSNKHLKILQNHLIFQLFLYIGQIAHALIKYSYSFMLLYFGDYNFLYLNITPALRLSLDNAVSH